jgi:hypothetical protein
MAGKSGDGIEKKICTALRIKAFLEFFAEWE